MKNFILLLLFASMLFAQNAREKVISVDFEGADIRTVLRAFSELGNVNIVATKDVKGTVTVKMVNVPWKKALKSILDANGLVAVEEEGIIKVMTLKEYNDVLKSTALQTRVIKIKYARADKLEDVITSMITQRGKIKVESRTNSLVITDVPSALDKIEELIKKLDTPTPQVLIQAKMVEVDYEAVRELGINWKIGNVDNPSSVTHGEVEVSAPATTPIFHAYYGKIAKDFNIDATLTALESQNKANILSQPSILVAENQEALILSGKKIPIVTRDFAGNQIIQFYDVALKLTVKPHISPDGKIAMELHPELSDIAGQAAGAAGPIISSQEAKTTLTVDDGETVVIGGIIKSTDESIRTGIPILSRIPILKYIFSYVQKKKRKSELLIFVTPKIVTSTEEM